MASDPVLGVSPTGFPWSTPDPFLFCAHHEDAYPAGNDALGPAASLAGRDLGQDFEGKDGWRMYHGRVVPGFPQHPHRGFETVTIVRRGLIDHSDSLGATARFGDGDVQWLTAGKGVVHSEMFPLLDRERGNPLELFQIWLNLPRTSKLVDPYFSMLWRDRIPAVRADGVEVHVVAGPLVGADPPPPPPDSWAARPDASVAIWTLRLDPLARWTLPAAPAGVNRALYLFRGGSLRAGRHEVPPRSRIDVHAGEVALENGPAEVELLLLQGRPIGEPVVQHGPFVMNGPEEIQQALVDYRHGGFGAWSWPSDGPVHPRDAGRFARYPDGRIDRPG
jgi:hypothetical protein